MRHRILLICLFAAISLSTLPPAQAAEPAPLTQRDLMIALVNGLGWSFGLPDAPTDADYLKILAGQRHLRLEVERLVDNDSPLITKEIFSFGNFSGEGWLQGPRETVQTTLPFLLPLSGTYQVHARLMAAGFNFGFGDSRLPADGGNRLTDTDLGSVTLSAGPQQIMIEFPARGGLDFIELDALPVPPVAPPGGWVLDKKLTTTDLASTALQALTLLDQLPTQGKPTLIEAESLPLPTTILVQKSRHHGAPSGGAWIRAGANAITLQAKVKVPTAGIYTLGLRIRGRGELTGRVNNTTSFQVKPGPALNDFSVGAFALTAGENQLTFFIPPFAGLDVIKLVRLDASPAALTRLAGLQNKLPPSRADLNAVIQLLAAFGTRR